MNKNKFDILLSPWIIISGMVLGIIIGIKYKMLALYIKPFGDIYLALLQMCVIPIMASAVVVSVAKLLRSKDNNSHFKKIMKVFAIFLFSVSFVSLVIGFVAKPFMVIDVATQRTIGEIMIENVEDDDVVYSDPAIKEIDSKYYEEEEKEGGLVDFIINIVPRNIFKALTDGDNIKIVFFFMILGVMINFIPQNFYEVIIILFEGCFCAFQQLISVSMYLLPFGLCALMATQFSQIGFPILISLMKLILVITAVFLFMFIISTVIVWKMTDGSYLKQFKALKDAIIICLGTRNSLAAIPSGITGLNKGLKLNKDLVNLSVTLGITLCRYAYIIYFSISAIFAMQLYGCPINMSSFLIIIFTSVLAALSTAGAPGLIAVTMVSIILTPLGIPPAAIIVILLAIDPILDPIVALVNLYLNSAAAAVIASDKEVIFEQKMKLKEQVGR